MEKPIIKIDIVSDVVCPWCYIGKRRLEKAIKSVSDKYNFTLVYHPFELNPNMPQTGVNQKEYLSDKFGGEERYQQITDHTTQVAATEGLQFNFAKQNTSPNTRKAHSIIALAQTVGKQLEMVETLFKAYFTDGVDLSKDDNLIALAVSIGLDKKTVETNLADDDANLKIAFSEQETQKLGISGVPFYIINNTLGVSGAQLPETFIKAFEDTRAAVSAPTVDSCDIENKVC